VIAAPSMASMRIRRIAPLLGLAAGAVMAFSVACGGGGDGAGTGDRITDPALVPTSTPIQNPITFRLRNDEITIQQGGGSGTGSTPAAPVSHTIGDGETCADIADTYGITVETLIRTNRSINADCTNLVAGDTLRIPQASPTPGAGATGTTTPGAGGPGGTHTVVDGDTCADIAAAYGVDVNELIALNGLDADCTDLDVDQVLRIP
jgi:LysM repeat protein